MAIISWLNTQQSVLSYKVISKTIDHTGETENIYGLLQLIKVFQLTWNYDITLLADVQLQYMSVPSANAEPELGPIDIATLRHIIYI